MTNMITDPAQVALSIRQPWVELILLGRKTIEVRSWPTRHRGELWLHAGMTPPPSQPRPPHRNPYA